MVSSASLSGSSPHAATARSSTVRDASKLGRMRKPSAKRAGEGKNYSEWDETFVAPMRADVPLEMGGMRLDQALARLFPQYSRNRLQDWLRSGHVAVAGNATSLERSQAVTGGETIVLTPPQLPAGRAPQAQRMALKVVHEDESLIVIDKPAGLVVHP